MPEPIDDLLKNLQERAKELSVLYHIEEVLNQHHGSLEDLFQKIIHILPSGWRYPDKCQVRIEYRDQIFESPRYEDSPFKQSEEIIVEEKPIGRLTVVYNTHFPEAINGSGPFLKEEERLIRTIADRIGQTIFHKQLKEVIHNLESVQKDKWEEHGGKLPIILDTLRHSDQTLFIYISRRMLHHLCWVGIEAANQVFEQFVNQSSFKDTGEEDINRPSSKQTLDQIFKIGDEVFRIAVENLSEDKILDLIRKWIGEHKSRFLVRAIENPNASLNDVINAITRYRYIETEEEISISPFVEKGLRVSLIRRCLSDHLTFINTAKNFITIRDYFDLVQRIICPDESRGKVGGKAAGLFLAYSILSKADKHLEELHTIRVPSTWYLTSDTLTYFVHYNNLEDISEQKYKEIEEIRIEYPNIVQIFKNCTFPPEIIKRLGQAVDQIGDHPIIVRSSSLLEDRVGAVFSGKYKSLFLANQGGRESRLKALMDAIAEVYASIFAPDPIEYRAERGLLDYFEEMGILIQEVVGNRIGSYFFPSFAGVAFARNEFRWSSRLRREDGLLRIVPGLGTRAVDRLTDDYPVMVSPGKPEFRVNLSTDEILRYSPKRMDILNLKKNTFETIELQELFSEVGAKIPGIHRMVSIFKDDHLQRPSSPFALHFDRDTLIVTFEGLMQQTTFIDQINTLLTYLTDKIGAPVDIEFAHDGQTLYLLQCRPQSYTNESKPSPIPENIPEHTIIFSANQFVSNGNVPEIHYIVYVPPESYNVISQLEDMERIGRIVGRLNKILPRRRFILIGPGRWGSRGDIKLGVNVTYSDINNTAMLIEVAQKKGNYTPEPSFGTHFFQDLVESSIRYLPLYPDHKNTLFNREYLLHTDNKLPSLLPEFKKADEIVRVIDVRESSGGMILKVLMNAELEKAVAFLAPPS